VPCAGTLRRGGATAARVSGLAGDDDREARGRDVVALVPLVDVRLHIGLDEEERGPRRSRRRDRHVERARVALARVVDAEVALRDQERIAGVEDRVARQV